MNTFKIETHVQSDNESFMHTSLVIIFLHTTVTFECMLIAIQTNLFVHNIYCRYRTGFGQIFNQDAEIHGGFNEFVTQELDCMFSTNDPLTVLNQHMYVQLHYSIQRDKKWQITLKWTKTISCIRDMATRTHMSSLKHIQGPSYLKIVIVWLWLPEWPLSPLWSTSLSYLLWTIYMPSSKSIHVSLLKIS